jgi:polygalacturonase
VRQFVVGSFGFERRRLVKQQRRRWQQQRRLVDQQRRRWQQSGGSSTSSGGSGSSSSGTGGGSNSGSTSSSSGTSSGSSSGGGSSSGASGGVIGTCDPSNLTNKTCLPPEPTIPTGCAMAAAPRAVTPTTEGGMNTLVPEAATETLDNGLIAAAFGTKSCVELTAGTAGANAFLIGQLKLTAGQTLVIDKGVTVYASRNPKSYGAMCLVIDPSGAVTDTSAPGDTQYGCGGIIMATGDRVAFVGEGVIDVQGGEPLIGVSLPTKNIDRPSRRPAGFPEHHRQELPPSRRERPSACDQGHGQCGG